MTKKRLSKVFYFFTLLSFFTSISCNYQKDKKDIQTHKGFLKSLEKAEYDSIMDNYYMFTQIKDTFETVNLSIPKDSVAFDNKFKSLREIYFKDLTIEEINRKLDIYKEVSVKFKLNKAATITNENVNLEIGGVKVDLNKPKVEGVNIFINGMILCNIEIFQGFGKYSLEISEVLLKDGTKFNPKPNKTEEKLAENTSNYSFFIKL